MKALVKWILLALLFPLLLEWFFPHPFYRLAVGLFAEHSRTRVSQGAAGRGAYCAGRGEPAVFLGRDRPEWGTYAAFEAWCRDRGGEIGWTA